MYPSRVVLFAGLCVLLAVNLKTTEAAAVHHRRSVTENSSETNECIRIPCGWAVYVPFTRTVDYFVKNTCTCPKGKQCERAEDDLSVSAYVHRCLDKIDSTGMPSS